MRREPGHRAGAWGTIYEDEHWIADHAVSRLIRGYLILKPKRHVHELADLLPEESASLGAALQRLTAAMRAALITERIYVCSFAETVHHLHFHLLPRTADMPSLGPDLLPAIFHEERWICTEEEAQQAADRVRTALPRAASKRLGPPARLLAFPKQLLALYALAPSTTMRASNFTIGRSAPRSSIDPAKS